MKKILTKKGFTLIELIVVIAILAILAAILIPSLMNYIDRANDAKDEANARSLYSQVMLEFATDPEYDPSTMVVPKDKNDDDCVVDGTGLEDATATCGEFTFPKP